MSRPGSEDTAATKEPSARQKAHNLALRRRKFTYVFLVVFAGLVMLGVLVSQFTARVDVSYGVVSRELVREPDTEVYQDVISAYFASNNGQRFRFATDIDALTLHVQQSHPEVRAISPDGMSGVLASRYTVELRQPVASWTVDDTRYYTDSRGVAFRSNFFAPPDVRVVDDTGASIDGATVASTRLLSFIGRLVALAEEQEIEIERIVLPPETTRTVDVHTNQTVARMTVDRGVGEQTEDLARALSHFGDSVPGNLDVRVEGRAFYR